MPECTVVNLRAESFDVYIGRAQDKVRGRFGNPFSVEEHGRERALELYREYFLRRVGVDPTFRRDVLALAGKRLGCFCKPAECHGDIIAAWVNGVMLGGGGK